MSAMMLSFTTTIDPALLERGMLRAVLAVLSERHDPTIDASGRVAILRRVQTMAAAYLDLCQQLGVVVPESVERWLEYLDAFDLLATLDTDGRH
jgi:triphosphoribosyl-dephospho-CoA synthetase